jgi:hypothetical protein
VIEGGKVKDVANNMSEVIAEGDESMGEGTSQGKELWTKDASQRASLASRALSQSFGTKAQLGGLESGSKKLKVMKDCIIFVDVRTEEGDDAGDLFVDMLRGMGAKVSHVFCSL